MRIITDEIDIFVLPNCGRCKIAHKNPIDMWECPIRKYDSIGDECHPDSCEHYSEEREE